MGIAALHTTPMNAHQKSAATASAFSPANKTAAGTSQTPSGAVPFLLGSVVLGTIGIFVHEAHAHPLTATWFRCAFGLLGLTGWLLYRKQLSHLYLPRKAWLSVLGAGVLMLLGWGMFFAAIERTSAGMATVLFHVQPAWMLIIAVWGLKETIPKRRIVCVTVAMAGLVLATGLLNNASTGSGLGTDYWLGVVLCLIGAFCTACVTLIAKRLGSLPAGVLAWWQCAIGTVVLLAWPVSDGWPAWGMSWVWLSGLGLIHTGLAYSLMYSGMPRLSTDRIAVFQFVYPASVIVFDWLLYGHSMELIQVAGIGVMVMAIGFAEHSPQRKRLDE